jgi:hypothetical protein
VRTPITKDRRKKKNKKKKEEVKAIEEEVISEGSVVSETNPYNMGGGLFGGGFMSD